MSDHDPLCPAHHPIGAPLPCRCGLIAKVRADERERQEEGWAARLNSTVAWAENGVLADLRAKVEALETGEGWYEWESDAALSEIAYVHENGEIYLPEQGWYERAATDLDWYLAAAARRERRLVPLSQVLALFDGGQRVRLPPSPQEWLHLVEVGGFPTWDPAIGGHLIVVSQPDLIQARCYCGWNGPDRTGDPHATGLVLDDTGEHCHVEAVRCPDNGCLDCREELW